MLVAIPLIWLLVIALYLLARETERAKHEGSQQMKSQHAEDWHIMI